MTFCCSSPGMHRRSVCKRQATYMRARQDDSFTCVLSQLRANAPVWYVQMPRYGVQASSPGVEEMLLALILFLNDEAAPTMPSSLGDTGNPQARGPPRQTDVLVAVKRADFPWPVRPLCSLLCVLLSDDNLNLNDPMTKQNVTIVYYSTSYTYILLVNEALSVASTGRV